MTGPLVPISRRRFVLGAAAATASLAGASCSDGPNDARSAPTTTTPRADTGSTRRVVVVGAGLAGLTAALDLRDAGWNVVVVEARDRVGGRVHTLHEPFSAGLHAEGGGESIDDNHDRLLAQIRRFGLTTERRQTDRIEHGYVWKQNNRYNLNDFVARSDGAVGTGYLQFESELARLADQEGIDPEHPESARRAAELDSQSLADFVDGLDLDPDARFLIATTASSEYASELDHISLLFALQQTAVVADVEDSASETMRIAGGNSLLVEAMAAELGDAVHLDAAVTAIDHDSGGVTVTAGGTAYPGAHVVLAVPPAPLRAVRFTPELPASVQAAIDGLQLGPATKVVTEFNSPFWRRDGHSGLAVTDLPFKISWDATDSYDADGGLLSTFTTADAARAFAALTDSARIGEAQQGLLQVFTEGGDQLTERAATIAWPNEPFTGGGYACYSPGQLTTLWPTFRAGHDRIRFAGEHTEALAGYMESAVRSGHRVAAEIGIAP